MTAKQALLISMLLGKALDAILTNVRRMSEEEVAKAMVVEEGKTTALLNEMNEHS